MSNLSKFMKGFENQQKDENDQNGNLNDKIDTPEKCDKVLQELENNLFNVKEEIETEKAENIQKDNKIEEKPKIKLNLKFKESNGENNVIDKNIDNKENQNTLLSNKERNEKLKELQERNLQKQLNKKQKDINNEYKDDCNNDCNNQNKNVISNINNDKNLEMLFIKSETPLQYKDKWYELYQKALDSNKNTITNQKVKNGKFRLDETGKLEILPDHETYGKTSNQLMKEKWLKGE